MSNELIFEEMSKIYKLPEMLVFCRMVTLMYNILYKEDIKTNTLPTEYEYDAKWWGKKYLELMDGGC